MIVNRCARVRWSAVWSAALLFSAAMVPCSVADARDPKRSKVSGVVDGAKFVDFAGEKDTLIEVNIRAPLLKILSKAVAQEDEDAAKLLSQIEAVSAVVVSLSDDDQERAVDQVASMVERLTDDGWDRIARVREDDEEVNVLALYDDEVILGITVLVIGHDDGENQLVFANIAGRLDLSLIPSLGHGLNLPGLSALSQVDWSKQGHSKKR